MSFSDRSRQLMDSVIDGVATEAEIVELEAILSQDEAARTEYLDRVALDMMLNAEFGEAVSPGQAASSANSIEASLFSSMQAGGRREQGEPDVSATRKAVRTGEASGPGAASWIVAAVVLGAAATLLIAVAWLGDQGGSEQIAASGPPEDFVPQRKNEAEANANGFAVITGQADARWVGPADRYDVGALLPAGEVVLDAGIVELELFSGVSVVVEGPAEFALVSPMQMRVDSGKVRAVVPEAAHGFKLSTREGDVIDLGTEFAVAVTDEQCDLHVLDGAVEIAESQKLLRAGQAARLVGGQTTDEFPAADGEFLGKSGLQLRIKQRLSSRIEDWSQWQKSLRGDSRVVVHYQSDASQVEGRRLDGAGSASSSAAIVAAAPAANRWGQAGAAIDFSPTGSRARLSVPGEHGSITFLAWVRIHSLDRWYNSLFLTDGHDQHEPHWQIMDDGRMFFSVKKRDVFDRSKGELDKHIYYSPPFWNAQLSGKWIMLTTTYDIENRRVRHFLNGEMLSEEAIPAEYLVEKVRIGAASIGNWGQPERADPSFAIRNLNGSLDEFGIFSAALSPVEIKEMYLKGRP